MFSQTEAGEVADVLISKEVSIQDKMWGDANERADSTNNQLLRAGLAQLAFLSLKLAGAPIDEALKSAKDTFYPRDWDGFRDYGSNVANLVVAAAFIRSEIKRRVMAGEDTTRTKRGEPYTTAHPYVSSEEAAA